jgi:subtilisin family serine protease/subtilisin-like proprotein convertase family protein
MNRRVSWPRSARRQRSSARRLTNARSRRLLLETLEDRALLTAGMLDPTLVTGGIATGLPYVPDEVLIGFEGDIESSFRRDGAGAALGRAGSLTAAFQLRDPQVLAHHPALSGDSASLSTRWRLPTGSNVLDVASRLSNLPGIAYAEPNYVVHVATTIPNDPQFSGLWGLNNNGQIVNGTAGATDADIDAPEAWDIAQGSASVIVGVIDTGVDYNHPDLEANIWTNPGEAAGNGIDDDANGYVDDVHGWDFANGDADPFDDNGHGTHVAGTIAGVGNNGIGVVGASWNAKIMALKFLDASGNGNTADAVAALNYASMMRSRGVDIRLTNNSYVGTSFSQTLKNAIDASGDAGMLVVAAAGNDNTNTDSVPYYPASFDSPNIISVAATDQSDAKASFSNFGANSVDLGAPGVNIYSTVPTVGSVSSADGYRFLDGTSMAAPQVAGVASLAWSLAPAANYQTIRDAILGGVDPIASMAGITVTGGRLNAYKTLQRIGMTVQGSSPDSGDIRATPPTEFVIDFSQPVNGGTLDPADLTVNLLPANSVTLLDLDTVQFHFDSSPVTVEGLQTMHMDGGAVATTSTVPLSLLLVEWNATFRYDALRMQVSATDPPSGGTISQADSLSQAVLTLTVNEPVTVASIGLDDILLSQGTVLGAQAVNTTTIKYTLSFSAEAVISLVMPTGALADQFGNPIQPFAGSYFVDWDTIELPGPLGPVIPAGSLVYEANHAALISTPGDTDSFTFNLEAGQTVAVVVDPASGLEPNVQVFDPSNELLGSASAGSGVDAALQMIRATTASEYRITVAGVNASTGDYGLRVILNAAVEEETHAGPTDDTSTTAQDLDAADVDFAGIRRAVVIGQADGFDVASAVTTTYPYPGSRVRIPDQKRATSAFTIADSYPIADLNVLLDITHTYDADLDVFLIAPDGTRVQLFNDRGSDGDNFTSTILDDEGATKVVEGSVPFTGRYRPDGRLSDFDGMNVQGMWTLEVFDDNSGDQGWLNSWSLAVTNAPQRPDYYGFTLAAGESATLALAAINTGELRLELRDASGAIVATGTDSPANIHLVIDQFSAPSGGQYYAVVNGGLGVDYSLMVLRETAFDFEGNNDPASAQNVAGVETILGAIESPDPVFVPQGSGGLKGPVDITFGTDGNLFVTDFYGGFVHGNREFVKRYDGITGEFKDAFATGPVAYGEGMAFGPDGDLYSGGQRFDGTTGAFISAFAASGRDVAFGPDGNFYVSDVTNNYVRRFNGTTGAFMDNFVPTGSGGLNFAWGLAFGPDGDLFVASTRTNNILRYDGATGAFLGVFVPAGSGGLAGPNMIVFGPDSTGDGIKELYVAAGDVRRYDGATGAFLDTYVAGAGASGVAFGPDGSLYVTSGTGVSRYRAPLRDQYQLDLTTGATVNLSTATPLGTLNGLDPRINLYSSSGTLVAFDDNSSADGRNAQLSYTAAAAGAYYVEIVPSPDNPNSTGEYILTVDRPLPPPVVFINDVARLEGNSGTTTFSFTVTRSGDLSQVVTVDFATSNGTATANVDYFTTSGTLTFLEGETQQNIAIMVQGDTASESNEIIVVDLGNVSPNAAVSDAQGMATILDDDVKFYVVNDATSDQTYEYSSSGGSLDIYALGSGNTAPRGAASTAAGDIVWVVDANKKVYVYNASGGLLGAWTAGGLAGNATVEGIATNGTDIWLVDSRQDKVFRFIGAASRLSGTLNAASNFSLNGGNTSPKDLVTDGASIWVVNDSTTDKVFKYTLAGSLLGSWTIDAANASPTGITLDPSNVGHLWIVDNGTDRVYQYDTAAGRINGSQAASDSFLLATGNANPQGIADPPVAGVFSLPAPLAQPAPVWWDAGMVMDERRAPRAGTPDVDSLLAGSGDLSWLDSQPSLPASHPEPVGSNDTGRCDEDFARLIGKPRRHSAAEFDDALNQLAVDRTVQKTRFRKCGRVLE